MTEKLGELARERIKRDGNPLWKDKALDIIDLATVHNLETEAFIGDEFEILICIYKGNEFVDIEFENSGTIDYIHTKDNEEIERHENIEYQNVIIKLQKYVEDIK